LDERRISCATTTSATTTARLASHFSIGTLEPVTDQEEPVSDELALATKVVQELVGIALSALAVLGAYSRVHTRVRFPGDVVAGSTIGVALAPVTVAAVERWRIAGS
jgi:membrane-associated phospholipid phosphatase